VKQKLFEKGDNSVAIMENRGDELADLEADLSRVRTSSNKLKNLLTPRSPVINVQTAPSADDAAPSPKQLQNIPRIQHQHERAPPIQLAPQKKGAQRTAPPRPQNTACERGTKAGLPKVSQTEHAESSGSDGGGGGGSSSSSSCLKEEAAGHIQQREERSETGDNSSSPLQMQQREELSENQQGSVQAPQRPQQQQQQRQREEGAGGGGIDVSVIAHLKHIC
jgi:hypothetical protein